MTGKDEEPWAGDNNKEKDKDEPYTKEKGNDPLDKEEDDEPSDKKEEEGELHI